MAITYLPASLLAWQQILHCKFERKLSATYGNIQIWFVLAVGYSIFVYHFCNRNKSF